MKLQNGAYLVEIDRITVPEVDRQRQDGRDGGSKKLPVEDLQRSIERWGLLQPIIISDDFVLQAGERRLTACRNLGHQKILARKASETTPVEGQIVELIENVQRLNLEWQDAVSGVAKIHQLHGKLDPDWTMGETAAACGLSIGVVSKYIKVFGEMAEARIAKAGSVNEAYNMIDRRNQRNAGEALQELLDGPDEAEPLATELRQDLTPAETKEVEALRELGQPLPQQMLKRVEPRTVAAPPPPEAIFQQSFLEWAPQYVGPKFNLLHCDFPYGVELFSGPQGRGAELGEDGRVGYKDSVGTYQALVECLCTNLDRFTSISAHIMFWLSADSEIIHQTRATFARLAPSLKFHKFPLIWVKSDNAGIASDPKHGPRHVYEACLLASRGQRNIARVKGDAYSAPTDKRLHPSTKPEPMLRHFMEMLVDETTSMLDPTCGSGASLRAAESLGANRVLGLEIDSQFIGPAKLALKQARQARAAARTVVL